MRTLHLSGLVLAGVVLTALAGCGGGQSRPRVAFVSNNPEDFWTIAEAGATQAAAEENVELIFRRPERGEAAAQREVIDRLLNQGIQGIAVSVINPEGQQAYLGDIAARVPLLTVDNDAPGSHRRAYIGTNNYAAGRAVGKLVRRALPDGGTVVFFVGDLAALNARQRRQGVIDELANAPEPADVVHFEPTPDGGTVGGKYKLYERTWTDQPEGAQKAKENAVQAINALKDVKGVCMVGLWAYNPPQILSAVKDAVEKDIVKSGQIKIVGFDEAFYTLDGVRDGLIEATVVQQPFEFGYRSVKVMAGLAKGNEAVLPAGGIDYVPYRILTREAGLALPGEPKSEAVAEFRTWLEGVLKK
jgi:ribose transport system substrate-binding protein